MNRLTDRLISVYSVIFALGLGTSVVFSSYFGLNASSYLSFLGYDTVWCDWKREAIGWHCFGDYHQFINAGINDPSISLINGDFVEKTTQGRSFLGTTISDIFQVLSDAINSRFALLLYLICLFAAMTFPLWHATKGLPTNKRTHVVFMLGVLTAPFFGVIDRGQQFGFVLPFLYFGGILVVRNRIGSALPVIAVAASIKPQFVLILLFFPIIGTMRQAARGLIWFFLASLLSFLIHGKQALERFWSWFDQMFSGGAFSYKASAVWPLQYGWSTLIETVWMWDGWIGGFSREILVEPKNIFYLNATITVALVVSCYSRRKNLNRIERYICLMLISMFSLGSVFGYYLAISIVVLSLVIANSASSNVHCQKKIKPFARKTLIAASLLSMAPVVLPYSIPAPVLRTQDDTALISQTASPWTFFITLSWAFSICALIFERRTERSAQNIRSSGRTSFWRAALLVLLATSSFRVFTQEDRTIFSDSHVGAIAPSLIVGRGGSAGDLPLEIYGNRTDLVINSKGMEESSGLKVVIQEDSRNKCIGAVIEFLTKGVNITTSFDGDTIADAAYFKADLDEEFEVRFGYEGSSVVFDSRHDTRKVLLGEQRCFSLEGMKVIATRESGVIVSLDFKRPRFVWALIAMQVTLILILIPSLRLWITRRLTNYFL